MQSRLSGAIALVSAQAAVLIFGYAAHLWIGNALGPAPYGIYGVVLSLQSIFGLFLTLGVPVAISRYVAQNEDQARHILSRGTYIQLTVAVLVASLVGILSPLIAYLLNDRQLIPYIIFSGLVIFAQAFYPIYQQFFSGLHKFNRQALLTFIYAAVKLIGALSLIYFIGVYGAFAGFAIGGLAAGVIGWYWTRRLIPRTDHTVNILPLRSFLSFAGTYVMILVGLQILISLDLFMVKAILQDNTQAGYYNAAVTLARIPYMLLQALGFVLLPSVSKLTSPGQSQTEAANFIRDTLRYLIALIVPSVALASATSQSLLELFYFGDNYTPAARSLTILMVGLGALAFYLLLANIIAGAGRARVSLYTTYLLVIISASSGYLLIPRLGMSGAAIQTLLAALIGLTILTTYTFKVFSIPLPLKSTVNVCIATFIAALPTYFWQASPLTLIPQYLLCFTVYLLCLFIIGEVKAADRQRLAALHPYLTWLAPR